MSSVPQTDEWSLFPRQCEGNVYAVNWSLCEDGVVPVGDAFRNARVSMLTKKVGGKVTAGKLDASKPAYSGKYSISESGDSISHEEFSELIAAQHQHLSSGIELFVEDAALGALGAIRNGVRVVTDDAATALIARALLMPTPPAEVNHRARFKGWNFDPRWLNGKPEWNGSFYDIPAESTVAQAGQRPIVAFVGGPGDAVSVQFVESEEEIVGANVVVGGSAPVMALVDGLGLAATVLLNTQQPGALALACTSMVKGKETAVVVGADEEVLGAIAQSGNLYGAYHNIISPLGVSALWNGYIGPAAGSPAACPTPAVIVGGKTVLCVEPNNMAHPATHIVFYEKGAARSKLSADEAVKRLVGLTDESKEAAIQALLKGASVSVIGKAADVGSIF
ncbi:hypothetical protein B484DRAFT_394836 [Ochromonadaceae sp. CCMP2298]|nr:hypothetical protein B484DRAFT_394836 [Ochromonadaceae sp. CCMP2298]